MADSEHLRLDPGHGLHVLHISDLHLGSSEIADKHLALLSTDLENELGAEKIDYLIVSGDFADRATTDDYAAALKLIGGLIQRFKVDPSRVIMVPGNHDVDWDASGAAYEYIPKHKLPEGKLGAEYIEAGAAGAMKRVEALYPQRFDRFNKNLFQLVRKNEQYPLSAHEQGIIYAFPEDRLLFATLNSCCEIDHHYKKRKSVNQQAVARILEQGGVAQYKGWTKCIIFHHAITGADAMDDAFLQPLAVQGFKIVIHGDIHEAIDGSYRYDSKRSLHIIGAGTFGAPSKQQAIGVPLQYNFMVLQPDLPAGSERLLTIHSRKREKPDGAWSADARWGDKQAPVAWRTLKC